MATTKGMTKKLQKQVKSGNMKRANAFSQIAKKNKAKYVAGFKHPAWRQGYLF